MKKYPLVSFISPLSFIALGAFLFPHSLSAEVINKTIVHSTSGQNLFNLTFFNQGDIADDGFDAYRGVQNWTGDAINSAMRAATTISNTFANTPGRALNIYFVICDNTQINFSSVADAMPMSTTVYDNGTLIAGPKNTWTATELSHFQSVNSGYSASVNNFEDVWKYGSNLGAATHPLDVLVRINQSAFNERLYFGEATNTASLTRADNTVLFDFESIILHEMTHPLGIYSIGDADERTAFEMNTISVAPPDSFLMPFFAGENTLNYLQEEGVNVLKDGIDKSFYNNKEEGFNYAEAGVQLEKESGSFADAGTSSHIADAGTSSHIADIGYKDIVMGAQAVEGEFRREYSELELNIFKDLGWTLVPEPSMFGLFFGCAALLLVATRRRRK